jgi:hypothetical protein
VGPSRTSWGTTHDDPIAAQVAALRLDAATIERVVRAVAAEQRAEQPVAIDSRRTQRRKRQLALEHADGRLADDEYLRLVHALADQPAPKPSEERVTANQAVDYLRDLGALWASSTEQEQADLLHAVYVRITVSSDSYVEVELTPDAYANGLALAMRETVTVGVLAPPAGSEPATGRPRRYRRPCAVRRAWRAMPDASS